MADVMYLRKSRVDTEMENKGAKDILERHELELRHHAEQLGRVITDVRRELVSGDTIAARPVMQQLLHEVEQGVWDAVHVMEVTRLARGDTMDQGLVARTFLYSGTLIITPERIYNPEEEADQEYFEFGLFMARREYKLITGRQQRGRLASIHEGKFAANRPPMGYERVRLCGKKGWTLRPVEPAAGVIRQIYHLFLDGNKGIPMGVSGITRYLNESGIPSLQGKDWTDSVVRGILQNQTYAGWVRWGRRALVKRVVDGELRYSRPIAEKDKITIRKGIHNPIIPQAQFDAVQAKFLNQKGVPGPRNALKNPLAGLVYCEKCGHAMIRRPYKGGQQDALLCVHPSCDTVMSYLPEVESRILLTLQDWLETLEVDCTSLPTEANGEQQARLNVQRLEKEQRRLIAQLNKAYELVEQGIYTPDVFVTRSHALEKRKTTVDLELETTQKELSRLERLRAVKADTLPQVRRVLEAYPLAETAKERNVLLKSVLEKVIYSKTERVRWGGTGMELTIFPRLPRL